MLTDRYLRRHTYLRVSVTDRCNLRCTYCMPDEGICFLPHDDILRNEEFLELIGIFASLGITKIRFTGGEPLVRRGVIDLITRVRQNHPDMELALTTNGVLLKNYLGDLETSGVRRLNISLDTLDQNRFRELAQTDHLGLVKESIEAAMQNSFFNIKINVVLFPETLNELEAFLEYFKDKPIVLRFIEMMPEIGGGSHKAFLPAKKLEERFSELGQFQRDSEMDSQVATMYTLDYQGSHYKIGIIPPVSHGFCGKCNRLRLTSDGQLKSCLYSQDEYNLKDLLRSGVGTEAIKDEILKAVDGKGEDRIVNTGKAVSRTMSGIGG